MPGPVSDSIDPEWGTSSNAAEIEDALKHMHKRLGDVIKSPPKYIIDVLVMDPGPAITHTFTEQEWRLLRFACERACENL